MSNNKDHMMAIEILNKTILKNLNNSTLMNYMTATFLSKGFESSIIEDIFSGDIPLNTIVTLQLMALMESCQEYFSKSKKDFKKSNDFEINKYFTDNEVYAYRGVVPERIEVKRIELKGFTKKNDYEYYGSMTYDQIYKYLAHNRFHYNPETQRATVISDLGALGKVKTASVDDKSVTEIKNCVLNNEFEDTQLVLNCRYDNTRDAEYRFIEVFKNENVTIGNLIINQKLDIIDGMHRIKGIALAQEEYYSKNRKSLEGAIGVRIVIRTPRDCMNIVTQSFKRSDTDIESLKARENTGENVYADKIINNSMLKGRVEYTYKDAIALNAVTYKGLIATMIKKLKIDVSRNVTFVINSMCKNLDAILNEINVYTENHAEEIKDKKNTKNYKLLKNVHMFSVYIDLAYKLIGEDLIDVAIIEELFDKIVSLSKEDVKELKLNTMNCSINKLVDFFN